jgi:hypothetical protein
MTSFNTAPKYFTKGFTAFNEEITLPDNCLPFTGAKFGLLNLQAVACGPSDVEHELVLTIDHSGSMDSASKLDQAIYTLKNIVDYLEEHPNIKANVTIFKFDDRVTKVIERTNVTEENYKSIEKKISKIRSRGGTNIEVALQESTNYIRQLKTLYPTHQISHIFLTDGAVTEGETDKNILKQLVDKDVYNYFIGYGEDHDAELLGILSDFEKSSYHYIDAIEKAGLVFGEILHGITHKLLYNCEIVIEHGVIYNYKSNLYTNRLYIGDIVGEANKVYHLFTDTPSTCYVHLKTTEQASNNPLEIHIFQETNHDLSFVNYAFRHRTLTLICEVKECQEKYDNNKTKRRCDEGYFSYGNVHDCKRKMAMLFDEMLKYMEDNNDKQNKFIKMLCDDIHISQKTIGTKYGRMCINSRQTSQGTQRIYTVNTTPLDPDQHRANVNTRSAAYHSDSDDDIPKRAPASCFNNDSDSEEYVQKASMSASARPKPKQRACAPSSLCIEPEPDDYQVSNNCMEDSPYLTTTATTVMRSISYISSDSDQEEDNSDDVLTLLVPKNDIDDDVLTLLVPKNDIDDDDDDDNDDTVISDSDSD